MTNHLIAYFLCLGIIVGATRTATGTDMMAEDPLYTPPGYYCEDERFDTLREATVRCHKLIWPDLPDQTDFSK